MYVNYSGGEKEYIVGMWVDYLWLLIGHVT